MEKHLRYDHSLPTSNNNSISSYSNIRTFQDTKLWFHPLLTDLPSIVRMMNEESCIENKYEVRAGKTTGKTRHITCTCHGNSMKSTSTVKTTFGLQENCFFQLIVAQCPTTNQWYIRKNAGHCVQHNGHIPLDKKKKEFGKRQIKGDVLKDAEDLLLKRVQRGVVQEFIEIKTGKKISKASISRMKESVVLDKFKKKDDETTAETLLNMMESDESIEWVAYYGRAEDAEKTVRVRKRSSKKRRKKKRKSRASSSTARERNNDSNAKSLDSNEDDECT